MVHNATGYWVREAGEPEALPSLEGDREADVLVVGGGFTGMWTAWHLTEAEPGLRVALLEAERIGFGPSGRNGGFVEPMWESFRALHRRHGPDGAIEVASAAAESVARIGSFCDERGIDAWFRRDGMLNVATAPAWDGAWRETLHLLARSGQSERARELSAQEVAVVCASPVFRGGVFYPEAATVQPARLGFGIRAALLERGVKLYERSPVLTIRDDPSGVVAGTPGGSLRADRVVLGIGGALAGSGSPLGSAFTVASSHLLITEPVPEVLAEAGWSDGVGITDCCSLVTYCRTTPDGRIALGWGGGRIAAGGRRHGRMEVDPQVITEVTGILHRYFPGTVGKEVEYAWGGPIDASPSHLPSVVRLPSGRALAAFGYTGNGVGPSQLVGRVLASLTLERRDRYSSLPFVTTTAELTRMPPEPFRWLGGAAIREAIRRVETDRAAGLAPDPVSRLVAGVPALIGFHIGR